MNKWILAIGALLILGSAVLLSTMEPTNAYAATRHTVSSEPNGTGTYDNPVYVGAYRTGGACSNATSWVGHDVTASITQYWCANPYVASWAIRANMYVLYSLSDRGVAGSSEYYISNVDTISHSFWYVWMRYGKDVPVAS